MENHFIGNADPHQAAIYNVGRRAAPEHTMHLVPFLDQKIRQICPVLTGNAGDERSFRTRRQNRPRLSHIVSGFDPASSSSTQSTLMSISERAGDAGAPRVHTQIRLISYTVTAGRRQSQATWKARNEGEAEFIKNGPLPAQSNRLFLAEGRARQHVDRGLSGANYRAQVRRQRCIEVPRQSCCALGVTHLDVERRQGRIAQ